MDLQKLLAPRSVAVIGATERPGHGSTVVRNLIATGYRGSIYPVNPKYETVHGLPAYPHLDSLPEAPECVVLAIPGAAAVDALRHAAKRGARAAVIYSSGFGETGLAGRDLEQRLEEVGREYDLAVCGPNCMGLMNFVDAIPLYSGAVASEFHGGNVAVVAQSGSVSVLFITTDRFMPAYVISSGNQTVTDAVDYLQHFLQDRNVHVISLFQESVRRPAEFFALVREANRVGKAVVLCKTGRSAKGAEATLAHTGAMASDYATFEAVCHQSGVVVAEDLDDMLESTVLLSQLPTPLTARGLGIINCSGGENALILDLADNIGLDLPDLHESTLAELGAVLPPYGMASNPLDVTGTLMFDPPRYKEAIHALARDPNVGILVSVHSLPSPRLPSTERYVFWHMLESLAEAAKAAGKPAVLVTAVPEETDERTKRYIGDEGIILLQGLGKSLAALTKATTWASRVGQSPPADVESDEGALHSTLRSPALDDMLRAGRPVGEAQAKHLLAQLGFPVTREELARDVESALAAAASIGGRVALKISSADITHKTDVGGVRLNVDHESIGTTFEDLLRDVRRNCPEAEIDGVLVQEMVSGGLELMLGVKRDPSLGPIMLLGLGGIYTEILRAFRLRQAPLSRAEALDFVNDAINPLLLDGARGGPSLDRDALVELVAELSRFAVVNDGFREIDLNPVALLERGKGVRIVDALIVP